MSKIILGFVGEMASGKGTASDYIVKKYQAGYHRFSTILRDILNRLHIEQTRENLQKISQTLRENFSQDILEVVLFKDINNDEHNIVCVDGIRRMPDIKNLLDLPNFYLINITADEKIRYKRIIKRTTDNLDDQVKTFSEFHQEQQAEAEIEIRKVSQFAKYKIDNNGQPTYLYSQLDDLINKLQNNANKN